MTFPGHGVGQFVFNAPNPSALNTAPGGMVLRYDGLVVVGTLVRTYTLSSGLQGLCVFGYGGWSKDLPAVAYNSEAGVLLGTVLRDLERETGERMAAQQTSRLGAHWVRPACVASRALSDAVAFWRVLPDGTTSLERPTPSAVTTGITFAAMDEARGVAKIKTQSPASILPGCNVQNVQTSFKVGSCEHHIGAEINVVAYHER